MEKQTIANYSWTSFALKNSRSFLKWAEPWWHFLPLPVFLFFLFQSSTVEEIIIEVYFSLIHSLHLSQLLLLPFYKGQVIFFFHLVASWIYRSTAWPNRVQKSLAGIRCIFFISVCLPVCTCMYCITWHNSPTK